MRRNSDARASAKGLEPAKLAGPAALDADYFIVPIAETARVQSVLTPVGGRVVHTGAPYGGLELFSK